MILTELRVPLSLSRSPVSHWVTADLRDSEANTDPHAWHRGRHEAGTTHHQLILQPVPWCGPTTVTDTRPSLVIRAECWPPIGQWAPGWEAHSRNKSWLCENYRREEATRYTLTRLRTLTHHDMEQWNIDPLWLINRVCREGTPWKSQRSLGCLQQSSSAVPPKCLSWVWIH